MILTSPLLAETATLERVSIQLKWFHQFQFAGIYMAKEKGFYKANGLDVTIKERIPEKNNILQVIRGESEYGVADSVILRYRAEGHPVKVLATIFQHNAMVLMSKKGSGIVSPFEMRGKRISFQAGLDDSIISSLMAFANLEENDYIKKPMDFSHMDFVNDEVDISEAYISIEPYWLKKKHGIDVNIIDPRSYGIDFYGDLIFTTEDEINEHPQRVVAFKKSTLQGWAYAIQHQDEAIRLILNKYNNRNLNYEQLQYEARITNNLIANKFITLGDVKLDRFKILSELYVNRGLNLTDMARAVEEIIYKPDSKKNFFAVYLYEFLWLGVVLAIIVVLLFWNNRRLAFLVQQRTEDLELAVQEAKSATAAKNTFLANMSHEIRTPMNGVLGMINLMLDEDLNAEQRSRALTVKHSGTSLLKILNDILDFSKIEAGKLELEIIDFNLLELLENFASTVAYQTHQDLQLICPEEPLKHYWYRGDPGRILQVITNLVGNAFKFTEQGEIAIHVDCREVENNQHLLSFTIRDTGIGLRQEQSDKLFQKFTQADSSTTRKHGGTGLGLSISKELVELMGGDISVSSVYGEGSSFTFNLKLQALASETSLSVNSALLQQRIIGIIKNSTQAAFIAKFLNNCSVEHSLVDSEAAAIKLLRQATKDLNPFTIVFYDTNIENINCVNFLSTIQEDLIIDPLKLVCLSNLSNRGTAEMRQQEGFTAYLSYPLKQSELYDVLTLLATSTNETSDKLITSQSKNRAKDMPQYNVHVLIVEDNLVNQKVAEGILKRYGMTTQLANNGQEALTILKKTSFDIVFMDCQMPVMDGFQATELIRDSTTDVLDHDITIIAMTANTMKGDREACLKSGMNDYIGKPISQKQLTQLLAIWLNK